MKFPNPMTTFSILVPHGKLGRLEFSCRPVLVLVDTYGMSARWLPIIRHTSMKCFTHSLHLLQHCCTIITTSPVYRPKHCRSYMTTMRWISLLAVATMLTRNAGAQNMLRFACSQLVVERTDPLVNPGMKYTPHLHQIVGGNAFNITMDPRDDPAQLSTCTSCSFVQDKSNYWTAVMFFKHKNGSYIRVPQVCYRRTNESTQRG